MNVAAVFVLVLSIIPVYLASRITHGEATPTAQLTRPSAAPVRAAQARLRSAIAAQVRTTGRARRDRDRWASGHSAGSAGPATTVAECRSGTPRPVIGRGRLSARLTRRSPATHRGVAGRGSAPSSGSSAALPRISRGPRARALRRRAVVSTSIPQTGSFSTSCGQLRSSVARYRGTIGTPRSAHRRRGSVGRVRSADADRLLRPAAPPSLAERDRAPWPSSRTRDRRARPDDLRLAGRGRQPGVRAAARPRPARPQPSSTSRRSRPPSPGSTPARTAPCRRCGRPIAPERLEALPWAALASTASAIVGRAPDDRSSDGRAGRSSASTPSAPPPATLARRRRPHAARAVRPPRPRATGSRPSRLQPIGAFKIRGAYVAVASLDAGERARGVITYSSGNHAQGVARAARLLGVAGRRRHAVRRARPQARAGRGRRRRGRRRRDRVATSARRSPSGSRPSAASRSSRRTTTTGSSPARAPSAWRSPRTCRTSPRSSCRSAAAGSRAGWRPRSGRWLPGARVDRRRAGAGRRRARRRSRPAGSSRWAPELVTPDDRRRDAHAGDRAAQLRPPVGATSTTSSRSPRPRSPPRVRLAAEESRLVVEPSGRAVGRGAARSARREAGLDGARRAGRGGRVGRQRRPGALPRVPGGADPARGLTARCHPVTRRVLDDAMAGEDVARPHESAHPLLIQSPGGCYPATTAIAFSGDWMTRIGLAGRYQSPDD